MTKTPRILITNDDGIHAPGITLLEEVARTVSPDVFVVAPETNHSGAGHSLTLRRPLRTRRIDETHYAIDGTPTDCVMLALQHILHEEGIDLVLSGINYGANLGEDVTYSGTVAAAMEATLLKLPAIALSQCFGPDGPIKWETARAFAPQIIEKCLGLTIPRNVLFNVNFPALDAAAVRGIKVARQGIHKLGDDLIERIDPRGEPYVWIGVLANEENPEPGTDLAAIDEGFVTITPIQLDFTHDPSLGMLKELFP